MTEQNSLDKFRSKEVEERFQELISGIVNEEFENMNTALDPQPVGCSKDGTECRIRFIKKTGNGISGCRCMAEQYPV